MTVERRRQELKQGAPPLAMSAFTPLLSLYFQALPLSPYASDPQIQLKWYPKAL